jgi:hypothetical protein
MGAHKNSRSTTAGSPATPPQTTHAPTPHPPFRKAGVPPALLQLFIPPTSPSTPEFLIENARLRLPAKPTKQSTGLTSNRERMEISQFDFPAREPQVAADHRSLVAHQGIPNRNIRFTENRLTPATAIHTHFLTATKQHFPSNSNIAPRSLACKPPA